MTVMGSIYVDRVSEKKRNGILSDNYSYLEYVEEAE